MSEIQFIVERLNDQPFEKNLSLVAFDEKSAFELLTTLNDIFVHMDPAHDVDMREETDEARAARMLNFLKVLKFRLPDTDARAESFNNGLVTGDRNTVYPVMHWALQRLPQLTKRAYVARYLLPLEFPPELMQEMDFNDTFQHYKELQGNFKEVHRTVDQLRANPLQPGELRREITTLEDEKKQLDTKISALKRKTQNLSGFDELLAATSSLRLEQEAESKMAERQREQRAALAQAEFKYKETNRKLQELRTAQTEDVTAEALLERLENEVSQLRAKAERSLPREMEARMERMSELQRKKLEPTRTQGDVDDLSNALNRLHDDCSKLSATVEASVRSTGDDKLALFRRQAQMVAKKLGAKEEELERAGKESSKLAAEVESKETRLSELAGPKVMGRDEFKAYAARLRHKTNQYKRMKQELADIRAETVVLNRTEQILKGRYGVLSDQLGVLETENGVSGYMDTQTALENVSSANAALNETKGRTLEEISKIVTDINQALKLRKNKLAPQIKELRAVRAHYQELEQEYLEKKGVYENQAVGLETERIKMEEESSQLQEECLREESRYHYLNCLSDIAAAHLDRVTEEAAFEKGQGRLLRDFRCYKDLYQHKVQQQEALSKELRKQQKSIKENESGHMQQRQMFSDLRTLLACKARVMKQASGGGVDDSAAALGGFDTVIGGANVMTLGDN